MTRRGLWGLLLCVFALGACHFAVPTAKEDPAPGGSVTEALVGRAGSLNPLFAGEDDARDIDSLIYQGLTTIGRDQQPAPLLASSWTVSGDGLTYVFTLRHDVRWADGAPFTAADVLFTFGLLQSPDYSQSLGTFWRDVKIDSPAADQVRFVLKAPSASFPQAMRIGILPRHAFKDLSVAAVEADPHSTNAAFGTGPFQVASISGDRRTVTLARNRYAKPRPYLDSVIFRSYPTAADALSALAGGQVDTFGGLQPPQLSLLLKRPDLTLRQMGTYEVTAVLMNPDPAAGPFADVAVRQALERAVDRGAIVRSILAGRGVPALGPIPPSDWAYMKPPGPTSYDPRGAEAALAADGWVVDPSTGIRAKGGVPLRVTLDSADAYPYLQVAEAVRDQLRKVGVQVDVQPVSASELVGRYLVGQHYQMALAAFDIGPDPDEWTLWHSSGDASGLNFAGQLPHQALIDKDLEDGRAGTTRAARLAAYHDFQILMWQAAPALFLYEPDYLYAMSSRINGFVTPGVIEPADRFYGVARWYVSTRAS